MPYKNRDNITVLIPTKEELDKYRQGSDLTWVNFMELLLEMVKIEAETGIFEKEIKRRERLKK